MCNRRREGADFVHWLATIPRVAEQDNAHIGGNLQAGGPHEGDFKAVVGRTPDRMALAMDRATLEARTFEIGSDGFTVELWLRHFGMGSVPGPNHPTSGSLVTLGDGVRNGWGLTMRFPEQELSFSMGRAKGSREVIIRSRSPVAQDVWHHIVATWDGAQMTLYVNGIQTARSQHAGPFIAPNSDSKLRVGFVGNGFGSVRFEIDELSIHRGAVGHEAALRSAFADIDGPGLTPFVNALLHADRAFQSNDFKRAARIYAAIAATGATPSGLKGLAALLHGQSLREMGEAGSAFAEFADLAGDTSAPMTYRRSGFDAAVRHAFSMERPELAARLAWFPLSVNGARQFRMDLARHFRLAGRFDAALAQFDSALALPGLPMATRIEMYMQRARFHEDLGHDDAARNSFNVVAAESAAAPIHRAIARFEIGESLEAERRFAEAIAQYRMVSEGSGYPGHLRWEATQRAVEARREQQGLRRVDPVATRTRVTKPRPADVVYYVAPAGSDTANGSRGRPFSSLARARDAIREARKSAHLAYARFDVVLEGGHYPLDETFRLTEEDSGREDAPVVYRAEAGAIVTLSGAVRLRGLRPVKNARIAARLKSVVAADVREVDLAAHGFRQLPPMTTFGGSGDRQSPVMRLYANHQPMPIARWPDAGFVITGDVTPGRKTAFKILDPRPSRWKNISDVWVHGYWRYLWADYAVAIASLDTAAATIEIDHAPPRYGLQQGMPYYYFNVIEELDARGEWYADRQQRVLYLRPLEDETTVYDLARLQGPVLSLENVSHVVLQGVVIEGSQTHGLTVSGGSGVILQGITVRNVSRTGVVVAGGHGHKLLDCAVHDVGGGAVILSGGNRRTLAASGHVVENCHLRDFAQLDRGLTRGIELHGAGGRIAHNLIHDAPDAAIRLEGNNHLVEFNEVHDVVQFSDDMGALDIYDDPSFRGNVIRYNYWHDIGNRHPVGQNAIRLDDGISGTVVYGNIFLRASRGAFGAVNINGGKDNWIDNNIFVDSRRAIGIFQWDTQKWSSYLESQNVRRKLTSAVDVRRPPFVSAYPELSKIEGSPTVNHVWRNLAFRSSHFLLGDSGQQDQVENLATWEDPGFANYESGDFRLASAKARWTAFRPIPFEVIGLYESAYRPRPAPE